MDARSTMSIANYHHVNTRPWFNRTIEKDLKYIVEQGLGELVVITRNTTKESFFELVDIILRTIREVPDHLSYHQTRGWFMSQRGFTA